MKLYLAGPMAGIENHNYPAFHAEAARLRALGYDIINPAEIHEGENTRDGAATAADYRKCLPVDIQALTHCDGLFFLPNWASSKGALLEAHAALLFGLPCYYDAPNQAFCQLNPEVVAGVLHNYFLSKSIPSAALWDMFLEMCDQDAKWGVQNHDNPTWLAILSEEIGESSQALLHDKFGGKAAGTLRAELVQVAAVAIQWIDCIDRKRANAS